MEDAKFPPPIPASAATASRTPNEVSGRCTTQISPPTGMRSNSAETIVQFRPPNSGTAKV